jgi:hypothetical protein
MKHKIILFALLSLILASSFSFAYEGKTYIPTYKLQYYVDSNSKTNYTFLDIYLSNVTSTEVDVSLTLYDAHGDLILNSTNHVFTCFYASNVTYYAAPTDISASFTIGPFGSTRCKIMRCTAGGSANQTYGYGVIQYTQNDEFLHSLIGSLAEIHYRVKGETSDFNNRSTQLNQGRPF